MGDKRLQELARGYARDEIPVETYRAQRAALLDSLAAGAAAISNVRPHAGHSAAGEREPAPWLKWLPLGVASLALATTLFWILASS